VKGFFDQKRRHSNETVFSIPASGIDQHPPGLVVFYPETRFFEDFKRCGVNGEHLVFIKHPEPWSECCGIELLHDIFSLLISPSGFLL
jgi:hypothetical protein